MNLPFGLTQRECACLYHFAECGSLAEAARAIGQAQSTFDRLFVFIRKKMGVSHNVAAVVEWDRFNRVAGWKPKGDEFERTSFRSQILECLDGGGKTTRQIADALGIIRPRITSQICALRDLGKVHTSGTSGQDCVWFLVDDEIPARATPNPTRMEAYLATVPTASRAEAATALGISPDAAGEALRSLRIAGKAECVGAGRHRRWRLAQERGVRLAAEVTQIRLNRRMVNSVFELGERA